MFPLFELARLLNFANDAQKTESTVTVRQYAWKEVGERSFLALLFSNGYFLFRHATHGLAPVCRQLAWYTDRIIQSMTFDPLGTWLLCVSTKEVLYLVPALPLLDNRTQVTQPWKTDDVTKIRYRKKRGLPICLTWWRTFNGEDIAVIGTKLGFVVFVDLRTERVVGDSDVNEQVSNIDLLQNDEHTTTHALVTTKSNTQWKILLETCNGVKPPMVVTHSDSLEAMGYETVDQYSLTKSILHDMETHGPDFQPLKCQQFSTATFVAPLYIKGRNLVAARDLHKKLFEIYDISMERSPLYVYTIPETVNDVIMTDRLLFFTSTEDTSCLEVVATQLSEASVLEHRQEFNKEAVLQTFKLRPEERIIAIFKRTYPFYWHEKLEEEQAAPSPGLSPELTGKRSYSPFRINSHTVLDGCIVLTTQNIYECRPRVSPEALFVELAVSRSDYTSAETLAIALGLDVNALYYLAAQLHLSQHDYSQAARFFQLAKCPHLQRVGAFAQYGCMSEVLRYLQQTLSCHLHELKKNEGHGLSSMAVIAFIQQLLEDKSKTNELMHQLREFLVSNSMYNCKEAAELLVSHGFYDLALEMGEVRDCMIEVLIEVYSTGGSSKEDIIAGCLSQEQVHKLHHNSLAHHIKPADLVHLLQENRDAATRFMSHFLVGLHDLNPDTLLKVTQLFDVSHPVYKNLINRKREKPHRIRYGSTSSVDLSLNDNTNPEDTRGNVRQLVEVFSKCVILLNHHREKGDLQLSFREDGFSPPYHQIEARSKAPLHYQLGARQQILSAGINSSAMIHGGKLYVWGEAFEEERTEEMEEKGPPSFWQPYSPLGLRACHVTAVACGAHHSLALTNHGVYSWGDNRYGQLGIGRVGDGTFCGPQKVSGLEDVYPVSLECGHYHSLLLTDDCRVYSWGWGVHGQLGHGDVLDRSVPKVIQSTQQHRVCDIAAGYGHSLFCTDKGEVYACGSGIFGQLGLGTTTKHSSPKLLAGFEAPVCSVATKDFQCIALTKNGEVYQWGASPNQLCFLVKDQRQARLRGYPTQPVEQLEKHLIPRVVNTGCVGAKIVKVECGGTFGALLTEDGEVFTFGKNFDGQLGIGNRNEQKIPVIVNRINDRKVAALTCGGDHMVVMDTEYQVWAWGRNDYGQLAVVTSQGPCPSGGGQGIYVSMGIYAAVWPVKVPSLNKITASTATPKSLPLHTAGETEGKWVTVIPKLYPYPCDALFTLLQHLPIECDPTLWLHMCLDYKLPVTAASLALHQGAFPLALHCHLDAFTKMNISDDSLTQRLETIAHFYYRKLEEEDDTYDTTHIQMVQHVICQLAEIWHKENCDIDSFTRVISKFMPNFAWAVFLLLTRSADCQSTEAAMENESEIKDILSSSSFPHQLPAEFISKLNTPFCLEVASCVVQLVEQDKIPKVQASKLCPNLDSSPEIAEDRRVIPTEKLWNEIFQNLRKDSSVHSGITLTQNDLDVLIGMTCKEASTAEGSRVGDDAVVFTCGHYMSRKALLEEILPEFAQDLISMNLPQSSVFLSSHFRQEGTIMTACPTCVLTSIRSS